MKLVPVIATSRLTGARRAIDMLSSMSVVERQGLNLLRKQDEADLLEAAALKVLMKERLNGTFVFSGKFANQTEDMLAQKRRELGMDG